MKTCTRCGANAYVDADPYCEHAYHAPPMPTVEPGVIRHCADRRFERGFAAYGDIGGKMHVVRHPTRDGAIALWQERWTWAPVVRVLAERLLGPPFRGIRCPDGTELRVTVERGGACEERIPVSRAEFEAWFFGEIMRSLRDQGRADFRSCGHDYTVERESGGHMVRSGRNTCWLRDPARLEEMVRSIVEMRDPFGRDIR